MIEQAPDLLAEEENSDDESVKRKKKFERFDPDHKVLDKDGLYYKDSDQESEGSDGGDETDSDQEDLGLTGEDNEENEEDGDGDERIEEMNDGSKNSLLVDLNGKQDRKSRKEMKAGLFLCTKTHFYSIQILRSMGS